MTVYKAFRNFIIALAIVGIIVTGSLIGFSAYKIYDYTQPICCVKARLKRRRGKKYSKKAFLSRFLRRFG